MGSLLPGALADLQKPKGIEEFDETFEEPRTAGSEYQRQLLRRYTSMGTPVEVPHPRTSLERTSLERTSLDRNSLDYSLSKSPTLQRQGSLRLPARRDPSPGRAFGRSGSLPSSPRSPPGLARFSSPPMVMQERSSLDEDASHRSGWWGSFDSAYLNRQVQEGDEEFKQGSFKPQYGVAGQQLQFRDMKSTSKGHSEIQADH